MNSAPEETKKLRRPQSWLSIPRPLSALANSASSSPIQALSSATSLLGGLRHTRSLNELNQLQEVNLDPAHDDEDNLLTPRPDSRYSGASFPSKMSFSAYMPSLSGLSLSRTSTNEEGRGRKAEKGGSASRGSSAIRSMSPFRKRSRTRERSPSVEALRQPSDGDSDTESVGPSGRSPRNAFGGDNSDSDEEEEDLTDQWDEQTEDNTEKNALIPPAQTIEEILEHEPDPLGEGVNVIRPDVPIFTQQIGPQPRRRRTLKADALVLHADAPHFQRDQCSIRIVHGDPTAHCVDRTLRKYMVASDLSEESKYAVEWAIGTVLKDGDELTIVTISETEHKLDGTGPTTDRLAKLRNQQERQALVNLLVRQATSLLQRTRLHVVVHCIAIHAKNTRHMLLDMIDIIQPIMVIVGSRGIGKLKGILLGSTSHYLVQKSSVPVMVARRRLKRAVHHSQIPPRTNRHVSLAEATIEKVGKGGAEKQVQEIRDEIAKEEASRQTEGEGVAPTLVSPAPEESGLTVPATPDSESSDSDDELKGNN